MKRVTALALFTIACVAFSGCEGRASQQPTRHNRLIVLGRSIGGIRLDEQRASVEKAFGHGRSTRRGLVSYFGGRLSVDYWFHDQLTMRVEYLETRWGGFHTRSGVHVGSDRQKLRAHHVACGDAECSRAEVTGPDAPGTVFKIRHGKVTQIAIGYS